MRFIRLSFAMLLCFAVVASAQTAAKPDAPKPTPDVLIFTNGDQLTGKLVSAAGGSIVFASDMAGPLTIPFSKIRELRSDSSPAQFALLKKGVPVDKSHPAPEGTASITDGKVEVHPQAAASNLSSSSTQASIPVAEVSYLVGQGRVRPADRAQGRFLSRLERHGNRRRYAGALYHYRQYLHRGAQPHPCAAHRRLAASTQPHHSQCGGDLRQEHFARRHTADRPRPTPAVTTLSSIFNADSERDEYFSPRLYVLGDLSFDHNYAQGLSLQQVFGGGIGYTPIKNDKQELDFKADIHYEEQRYLSGLVNGAPAVTARPARTSSGPRCIRPIAAPCPRRWSSRRRPTCCPPSTSRRTTRRT